MGLKNFNVEENQKVWDTYYEHQLQGLEGGNYDKKKVSVNQYKPIVLDIDGYYNKPFSELTGKEINDYMKVTTKVNRENHLRGFFVTCLNNKIINMKKSAMLWVIPSDYRYIARLLIDDNNQK